MEPILTRKPRLFFETATNPAHVTFDDAETVRRTLPWAQLVEARWDHGEPDAVKLVIGDWAIVITGDNLVPLCRAIEDRTLVRICARPKLNGEGERSDDTLATSIRFSQSEVPRKGQGEFPFLTR